MFVETSKAYYKYIIDVETRCIADLRMNPFDLYKNMTLIDFEVYVQRVYSLIEQKAREQEEALSKRKGQLFPH